MPLNPKLMTTVERNFHTECAVKAMQSTLRMDLTYYHNKASKPDGTLTNDFMKLIAQDCFALADCMLEEYRKRL